jgi:hypothetical protein
LSPPATRPLTQIDYGTSQAWSVVDLIAVATPIAQNVSTTEANHRPRHLYLP